MPPTRAEQKSDDIVVFEILRDSTCAECGEELGKGQLLRLEKERPLCMACADLAHLLFLPRGDAAKGRVHRMIGDQGRGAGADRDRCARGPGLAHERAAVRQRRRPIRSRRPALP